MLRSCATVVAGLVGISILSKLLLEHPGRNIEEHIHSMVRQALHWRNVAAAETKHTPLHLTHLVTASTYLQAARLLSDDVMLERLTGMDVVALNDRIDRDAEAARQTIQNS